jgi:hypothetical protein
MPQKLEVTNLLFVEQAIPARTAPLTFSESEFLIEADRVYANASLLRGLTDLNCLRHIHKDKPWSYVQSQEVSVLHSFSSCFPLK